MAKNKNDDYKNSVDIYREFVPDKDTYRKVTEELKTKDAKYRGYLDLLYTVGKSRNKMALNKDRDVAKYVFFTRPQLNMSYENIALCPDLHYLLEDDKFSIYRYIRHLLDPRLRFSNSEYDKGKDSLLINHESAFIAPFSNALKSLSGWPDPVVPVKTSTAGVMNEQFSMVDGTMELFQSYTLDATFTAYRDDPIIPILKTWTKYMTEVYFGRIYPYMDMIVGNEVDYNTRIYVIVLGEAGNKIKRIACTGASFPITPANAKFYDISDVTIRTEYSDINIRFQCDGAIYDDVRIMHDFNMAQAIFNPKVKKMLKGENDHNLIPLPEEFLYSGMYRAIPLIDEINGTLEWFIDKDYIKEITI